LGSGGKVGVEQQGRHRGLVTLGMEMMLGRRKHVEAGVVGKDCELAQLVQHLLVALVVAPDRPQPLAVFEARRHRGQYKKHEFHRSPPPALLELTLPDSSALRSGAACEARRKIRLWAATAPSATVS